MKTDALVRRQLVARLGRLKARAVSLATEIAMIEKHLADGEKGAALPQLKLRKNSLSKWTVQMKVRDALEKSTGSVRAQSLLERLREHDPDLKSSTFRSHIKRMVEAGVIKQEGPRGHYQLVKRPTASDNEREIFGTKIRRSRHVHSNYIDSKAIL